MRFSANLGLLFTELPLLDAVGAAAAAGFEAVELHFPYSVPAGDLAARCAAAGLPIVSLNTARGDASIGEFGLCALTGRRAQARAAVEQAVAYAAEAGVAQVHVMAGIAEGPEAEAVFCEHLTLAAELAEPHGIGLLIEPLNPVDVPGYFLHDVDHAVRLIEQLDIPAVRLMFDCYHVQRIQGELLRTFERVVGVVGHVQFAGVPDRTEPDAGEVDYRWLLPRLRAAGYPGTFGAEYRPRADTADGLGWLGEWAGSDS